MTKNLNTSQFLACLDTQIPAMQRYTGRGPLSFRIADERQGGDRGRIMTAVCLVPFRAETLQHVSSAQQLPHGKKSRPLPPRGAAASCTQCPRSRHPYTLRLLTAWDLLQRSSFFPPSAHKRFFLVMALAPHSIASSTQIGQLTGECLSRFSWHPTSGDFTDPRSKTRAYFSFYQLSTTGLQRRIELQSD